MPLGDIPSELYGYDKKKKKVTQKMLTRVRNCNSHAASYLFTVKKSTLKMPSLASFMLSLNTKDSTSTTIYMLLSRFSSVTGKIEVKRFQGVLASLISSVFHPMARVFADCDEKYSFASHQTCPPYW